MSTAAPEKGRDAILPSDLMVELWKRIDRRLRKGEVLITNEQFYRAMVRDFRRVVGVPPDRRIKVALVDAVLRVNEKRPETYLTAGIKNAINQFLKSTGEEDAEAREMITRMVSEGRTAMWLEGMGIDVDARTLTGRVEQAILSIVEGRKLSAAPPRRGTGTRKRRARRAAGMLAARPTSLDEPDEPVEPPAYEPEPSAQEQQQRIAEEKVRTEELAADELRRAPRNLDAFLDQKLLTEQEASDLKKLYGIDRRLDGGEIDETEAQRLRGEIGEAVREKLKNRLRAAVDPSVLYLNAFEALRRMPTDRDDAMRLLIRHRNQVVSEDEKVNLSIVTRSLQEDDELLDQVGMLMERKDHEMRMMAANMPPYRHIYTPGQAIGKFTIAEAFVDDLRGLSREELSDRLNAADGEQRLKAAADIKCMVALLTFAMMNTTAFHREVRRLRIVLRLKHLFEGAVNERDGRNRVNQFLRRRLHSLYPDLTREERAEIEETGQHLIEGRGAPVEQEEDKSKRVYRV